MDILLLAMLALVTGALVLLFNQQRKFQRVDHSALIQQEDEERHSTIRLERLEELLGRLVSEERRKREETAAALSEVRSAAFKLRLELDALRNEGIAPGQAPPAPVAAVEEPSIPVLRDPVMLTATPDEPEMYMPPVRRSAPEAIKPRSLPQAGTAAAANSLFEQGMDKTTVARQLGLSSHAVELISALRGLKTA